MRTITHCRVCSSDKLTSVLDLGNQYLSDFVDPGSPKPAEFPLHLVYCEECKLVQLKDTTPPDELYTDHYGYRSGINNTIREDLRDVVGKVMHLVGLRSGDRVIDIGANDGTLLSNYPADLYRIGFEPVTKFIPSLERFSNEAHNDYFHKKDDQKVRVITAISCFYDLDDPNSFVMDLADYLDQDGVIVIQQNYLLDMLKNNAFDNICHEHVEYYSLTALENLLSRHGLRVFDLETNLINGGSIRTYICHQDAGFEETAKLKEVRELEKHIDWPEELKAFADRVEINKMRLMGFLRSASNEDLSVYLYGASTRGNTLLQYFGIDSSLVQKAVERNPEKFGKTIASVGIPIISEEQAREEDPDYLLVMPWFFKEEFIKREKEYLSRGGNFIFPLPVFEVV